MCVCNFVCIYVIYLQISLKCGCFEDFGRVVCFLWKRVVKVFKVVKEGDAGGVNRRPAEAFALFV